MFNYYKIKSSNLKMVKTIYGEQYVLEISPKFIEGRRNEDPKPVNVGWLPKFLFFKKAGNYRIFKVKVDSAYDKRLKALIPTLTDPWGFVSAISQAEAERDNN